VPTLDYKEKILWVLDLTESEYIIYNYAKVISYIILPSRSLNSGLNRMLLKGLIFMLESSGLFTFKKVILEAAIKQVLVKISPFLGA